MVLSVKFRKRFYLLILTCSLGAPKNHLIETVVLSTPDICFG